MLRWLLLVPLIALGSCLHVEPDYRVVEDFPHDWEPPPADYETIVSPPMYYEELRDYSRGMRRSGWRIQETRSVGDFTPQRYLVILTRPR